ncbi:MAG: hypothetical protein HC822_03810 [Oscillochloris sp.]|nr:hypothetical protein [Oscillochloris sp.]
MQQSPQSGRISTTSDSGSTSTPRSPLLRALPNIQTPGRSRRIVSRSIAWACLLGGAIWLALAVRTKAIGTGQVADGLYRIHDQVFLPIKGYTYTLFYPISLIGYGILLSIGAIWLLAYVSDRSWVRQPHLWIIRRLLPAPFLGRPVLISARLFARLGFPPAQLLIVAEYERDICLIQLASQPHNAGAARRLVRLTQLMIHLRLLDRRRVAALQACGDWQIALLMLQVSDAQRAVSRITRSNLVEPLLLRVLTGHNLGLPDTLNQNNDPLSFEGVVADILRQAAISGLDLRTLAASDEMSLPQQLQLVDQLIRSCEQRRQAFDQMRGQIERMLVLVSAERSAFNHIAPDASDDELMLLGTLAIRCAYTAGTAARASDIATGTIDACEALALVLAMVPTTALPDDSRQMIRRARLWLADLPEPIDYRLAAILAAKDAARATAPWQNYLIQDGALITRSDAELLHLAVDRLALAAGDGLSTDLRKQEE